MTNNDKKRVTVTLSNDLYNLLKRESDLMGVSVQNVLVFYVMEHIKQSDMIKKLPSLLQALSQYQPPTNSYK